jgi:methionyl-tRNA synthetase
MKKFYLTTAIDYPNALPHIGTAYEKICADVIVRYKRLTGHDTFFVMGSDEHSHNVERAAREQGITPLEYCDDISPKFEGIWKKLNISYDQFERSSYDHHGKTVQDVFQRIYDNGDIYKGHYEGWYCKSCERFYQEKDLDEKNCPVHSRETEWVREENYIFRLSKYQDKLIELLNSKKFAMPKSRRNEMLGFIKGGLEDISVSRESIEWGIELPFDTKHTVYVWFDALLCYISGVGYFEDKSKFERYWPCDVHVIGKDITRFHTVMWPAMLMSAGIDLPKMVWAHGWVLLGGEKLSKSAGHSVDPIEAAEYRGTDALRYYLVREIPFDRDGNFSWEKFDERYESDLANDLGNLLQRSVSMIIKYCDGAIPALGATDANDEDILKFQKETYAAVCANLDAFKLSLAVTDIWAFVTRLNKYVEESAPWKLKKDPEKTEKLQTVMAILALGLKFTGGVLTPFMPETAEKIWATLGIADQVGSFQYSDLAEPAPIAAGTKVEKPVPLFPKVED